MIKSLIKKRSVRVNGVMTSISLEEAFYVGLKEIAAAQDKDISEVVAAIDDARLDEESPNNLSSAIRLAVLDHYRTLAHEKKRVGATLGSAG